MTTIRLRSQGLVMPEAADFLQKWVRENITPTTAHVRDDTLTAGRLVTIRSLPVAWSRNVCGKLREKT